MKIIGAFALLLAGPALIGTTRPPPVPGSAEKAFTGKQIREYAGALGEIEASHDPDATQVTRLPPAELNKTVAQQEDARMSLILQRHGFDPGTFNAISMAVENRPDIRRKVRQAMMAAVVGIRPL